MPPEYDSNGCSHSDQNRQSHPHVLETTLTGAETASVLPQVKAMMRRRSAFWAIFYAREGPLRVADSTGRCNTLIAA